MKKLMITMAMIIGLQINVIQPETSSTQENAGWQVVASQVAPDGEKQITFENGIDLTIKPDGSAVLDKELNPDADVTLQKELDKLPTETKKELLDAGVEIYIQDGLKESWEEGKYTYGVYFIDNNTITLDAEKESIEKATLHEVGHALDDIHGLSYDSRIIESYEEKEISYKNPHFESSIQEYVAECILHFYNGDLSENTKVFEALESTLWR